MKLLVALLSMVATSATMPIFGNTKSHQVKDMKANSKLGQSLLSKARKLEQAEDGEVDFTWVADFSIKFQGCHHVSQWNADADEEEDVKISTKRLIRFRLCPANSCSATNAGGCSSGYGDYIIDMNTYLDSYFEAVEQYNEYKCEYIMQMVCDCDNDDGKGDDFDEEICQYDCYAAQGVTDICSENNPYNDDEEKEEAFELREYMECANWEAPESDEDQGRKLEEEEVEYFMGPYCAEQGGAIFLGLFTDDTCTTFADDYGGKETYFSLAGESMPYASESVVGMECVSCKEPEDFNEDGNDNEDEDAVIEMCEQIYQSAGKCEKNLGISDPNNNACTYMEGIKIVRKNGVVELKSSTANKSASVFIGLFVVAFVLLAAYVYYLRTKLDRASINLSE
jgi:hypothetical protein